MKDLPYHLKKDVDNELRKHNYHYLPTLRALQNNKKLNRRKTKRTSPLKQRDLDDIFIKELCYVGMEVQIKEHLVKKEENKRRAFLWAKKNGQLKECPCCYDDEVLEEDMDTCSADDTHKVCNTCIRR
ncbi:E3 ubiquitin-protein ligase [Penaeus vannamei]|uniref:E3 ubiquitin-protein ligase n=1 Tax=Penaeus vannamei TaxID=6689 RepID=A0A3R7PZF1_PENVA|nr:E3 ubiquitin-protein ligase [Penaeus vannamei]